MGGGRSVPNQQFHHASTATCYGLLVAKSCFVFRRQLRQSCYDSYGSYVLVKCCYILFLLCLGTTATSFLHHLLKVTASATTCCCVQFQPTTLIHDPGVRPRSIIFCLLYSHFVLCSSGIMKSCSTPHQLLCCRLKVCTQRS